MNALTSQIWTAEQGIETSATPAAIWRLFCDVPGWRAWNAGIEHIEAHGPFVAGSEFSMTPPGQRQLLCRLTEVRPTFLFVDETRVGDLTVTVTHRIERLGERCTRVTFELVASGDGCDEVGPVVAADFPDVLAALVRLAEGGIGN